MATPCHTPMMTAKTGSVSRGNPLDDLVDVDALQVQTFEIGCELEETKAEVEVIEDSLREKEEENVTLKVDAMIRQTLNG
jgi:hypothetical protein